MSATPPSSAFTAARLRQQQSSAALAPGTVVIGGSSYAAAVSTAARQVELGAGGFTTVMGFAASLEKSVYAAEPVIGTIVKIDGLGFKVTEVDGRDAYSVAWVLRGERVPGADD